MTDELGSAQAIINKIQTTVDGGVRLTLDLNPNEKELITKLLDLKLFDPAPCVMVGFVKVD